MRKMHLFVPVLMIRTDFTSANTDSESYAGEIIFLFRLDFF